MTKLPFKRPEVRQYYLNDYPTQANRFRIESTRGGERCLWAARVSFSQMEQTKRYLERIWGK